MARPLRDVREKLAMLLKQTGYEKKTKVLTFKLTPSLGEAARLAAGGNLSRYVRGLLRTDLQQRVNGRHRGT